MPVPVDVVVGRTPEWPEAGLDVDALLNQGWRSTPFSEFVVKVHERCNLACDYCYMYELADQSWRLRSVTMPRETIEAVARRISEHAEEHRLPGVSVVLHGGEPLLVGADGLAYIGDTMRSAMRGVPALNLSIQTNGTLLTEQTLDVLLGEQIKVGVSLDGPAIVNDRHRKYLNGRGSHAAAADGISRLRREQYRSIFGGLLCTIDAGNDPIEVYEGLLEFDPPLLDFLLPHHNWTSPPERDGSTDTPYADWLIQIFDRWYDTPSPRPGIRIFHEIIDLLLGRPGRSESLGLSPVNLVVVDTDGSIQQVDSLKSAFEGAPETGLNIHEDPFDSALRQPAIVARQIGASALCETCAGCSVKEVCGAGHYTHRYKEGTGFLNPSVYCLDLQKLIGHVYLRMLRDINIETGHEDRTSR